MIQGRTRQDTKNAVRGCHLYHGAFQEIPRERRRTTHRTLFVNKGVHGGLKKS